MFRIKDFLVMCSKRLSKVRTYKIYLWIIKYDFLITTFFNLLDEIDCRMLMKMKLKKKSNSTFRFRKFYIYLFCELILQFSASNILKSVRAIRLLQQTFRTYIKRQAIRLRRLEKIWDAVEFDYVNVCTYIVFFFIIICSFLNFICDEYLSIRWLFLLNIFISLFFPKRYEEIITFIKEYYDIHFLFFSF